MDANGFSDDVQYGKTKIFIRHPQTIFALEQQRTEKLPGIVLLLQRVTIPCCLVLYGSSSQLCAFIFSELERSHCTHEGQEDACHLQNHGFLQTLQVEVLLQCSPVQIPVSSMPYVRISLSFCIGCLKKMCIPSRNAKRSKDFGKNVSWPPPPRGMEQTAKSLKRAHARYALASFGC